MINKTILFYIISKQEQSFIIKLLNEHYFIFVILLNNPISLNSIIHEQIIKNKLNI